MLTAVRAMMLIHTIGISVSVCDVWHTFLNLGMGFVSRLFIVLGFGFEFLWNVDKV